MSARVAGAFYFVPFPGSRQTSVQAKAALILAITLSLFSLWPVYPLDGLSSGFIVAGMLREATIGICLGLVISLAAECLSFCFHMVGLQAGYTYASTVDPTSQADVPVMESLGNLAAGLLFFSLGFHHAVIRAFAGSLKTRPAGSWTMEGRAFEIVIPLFQEMLSTGLRLALPILASMVLIDIALALVGRFSQNLQLLFLAFPVKMLASLLLIGSIMLIVPPVYSELAGRVLTQVRLLIGI